MYVLSSLPTSQQSVASGLFQTVIKLCVTLGFGLSTAVFDHVSRIPAAHNYYAGDPIEPYAATFWFSTALSALSLMLCPLLRVGTQGHHQLSPDDLENQARCPDGEPPKRDLGMVAEFIPQTGNLEPVPSVTERAGREKDIEL